MERFREYIKRVRKVVRELLRDGRAAEVKAEVARIGFLMGIDEAMQREMEKVIRAEAKAEMERFVGERFEPSGAIKELAKDVGRLREGFDRQAFEIVRRGVARNEDSKTIQERLARLERTEERHYYTVQNTIRIGIARQGVIEQAFASGVSYFRYSGSSIGARPFCRERVGKVYSIEEIRRMDNGQGLAVEYFCGGWNCRHRWVAVAPGILKIEKGAKLNQDEREVFEIITNYGHNVVARKPVGRKIEGKTYDAVIDGQKAELKTITSEMADANVSEAVRYKMREAIKQGAEWILLYDKKGVSQEDIAHGILKFKQRSSKTFKKVSIIKSGIIKTQKHEGTKWE